MYSWQALKPVTIVAAMRRIAAARIRPTRRQKPARRPQSTEATRAS
jgi:hypothetical protein